MLQSTVGNRAVDGLFGIVVMREAIDKPSGKGIAAAHTVDDAKLVMAGFVEFTVGEENSTPAIVVSGMRFAKRSSRAFEMELFRRY